MNYYRGYGADPKNFSCQFEQEIYNLELGKKELEEKLAEWKLGASVEAKEADRERERSKKLVEALMKIANAEDGDDPMGFAWSIVKEYRGEK